MRNIILTIAAIATFAVNSYSQRSDTITVVAVGDIMYGSIFPDRSYLPTKENYKGFLD